MRSAALILCALSATAQAGAVAAPIDPPAPRPTFWNRVLEPHGAELGEILRLYHDGIEQIAGRVQDGRADADPQQRMLCELYGMLRFGERLAPGDARIAGALATIDDELGLTDDALPRYRAALRAEPETSELQARLGLLELRRGDRDAAIPHLRAAVGADALASPDNTDALLALANLAARAGDVASAVELLGQTREHDVVDSDLLAAFALVVLYDRDEQLGKRDDAIRAIRTQYDTDFGERVIHVIHLARLPDPEDRFYYQALLYETVGAAVEARVEWAHYAAVPDAPWRDRALAHMRALDARSR